MCYCVPFIAKWQTSKNLTRGLEGFTYREYRYVWQCQGLARQVHTEGFVVGCCWASATLSWKKGFFGLFWTTLYSRLVPCKVLKCRCWNVGNSEENHFNCFLSHKNILQNRKRQSINQASTIQSIPPIEISSKAWQEKKHWLF